MGGTKPNQCSSKVEIRKAELVTAGRPRKAIFRFTPGSFSLTVSSFHLFLTPSCFQGGTGGDQNPRRWRRVCVWVGCGGVGGGGRGK